MVHGVIEILLVVGVVILVLGAFMVFVGWSSQVLDPDGHSPTKEIYCPEKSR